MPSNTETPDPFAPVAKVPLFTQDGEQQSSRFAVMFDSEGINREVGVVSEAYQLIPNEVVHNTAIDVLDRAKMDYQDGGHIFDGKKYRQRWILSSLEVQPKPGDIVQLTLDCLNSYDGKTLFGLAFNARRLVCSNGMMVDFLLGGFKFRHFGGNGTFERELHTASLRVAQLVDYLPALEGKLSRLVRKTMRRQQLQQAFRDLKLPKAVQADAFLNIQESTAWGFLNGITDVLTRQNTHRADHLNRQVMKYLLAA